jgi:ACS family hexuronate transporter-like MFS transporter
MSTIRQAQPVDQTPAAATIVGRYRWRICTLLFFVTTLIYLERQVLGVLAPELERVIGWDEIQYGNIVMAFQMAYALGMLLSGRFLDVVGPRIGYALAIAVWTLATSGQSLARSVLAFAIARFVLGLAEAPNFPAAIKTVAEWFPNKERALATGIFNSGANIGAIVAPATAPWVAAHFGWQWAFVFLGVLSAIWIVPWAVTYRQPERHPRLSATELAYIQSDPQEPAVRVPWVRLVPHRQTWAFLIGKFLTDPIWWFFLYWLAKFLNQQYGLTQTGLGWPLVIVYTGSMVGSVCGGWLPAKFLKMGWSLNRARKTAMLICAVAVLPVTFAATGGKLWLTVALVSLATAAHQGWSANLFTLPSDTFPKQAVASVVGIGGFGGAVGGMLIATLTGLVLERTHSYVPMFVMASLAYLVAIAIIHLVLPTLERANLEGAS